MDSNARHPQTFVASIGAEVDCGVASLIELLNAEGSATEYSCQGDPGKFSYVQFTDAASFEAALLRFEQLANAAGNTALADRVLGRNLLWDSSTSSHPPEVLRDEQWGHSVRYRTVLLPGFVYSVHGPAADFAALEALAAAELRSRSTAPVAALP